MLAECVWRQYLSTFFGPLIKKYWPTSSIMKKPKFQVALKWFKVIHCAYLQVRSKIPEYRTSIPPENKHHFDFVCDLLECYVPFILFFEKTKNSDSFKFRIHMLRIQLYFLSALGSAPYVKVSLLFPSFTEIGDNTSVEIVFFLETKFSQFLAGFITKSSGIF